MNKIFFIDLDGTLFDDDMRVSGENADALIQTLEAGNYVVIATGRTVLNAKSIAESLGLIRPGCFIAALNGAAIYDPSKDRILREVCLPMEYARYLYDEASAAGIYIQTYSGIYLLTDRYSKELSHYVSRTGIQYKIEKDIWSVMHDAPPKMLLIDLDDKTRLIKFREDHLEWERGKCVSFFSSPKYLEYTSVHATKGDAVLFMRDFLNVDEKHTIAIGDEENDISMVREAYIGAAMKNGVRELIHAADYVTDNDNNHCGVAEVIKKFG